MQISRTRLSSLGSSVETRVRTLLQFLRLESCARDLATQGGCGPLQPKEGHALKAVRDVVQREGDPSRLFSCRERLRGGYALGTHVHVTLAYQGRHRGRQIQEARGGRDNQTDDHPRGGLSSGDRNRALCAPCESIFLGSSRSSLLHAWGLRDVHRGHGARDGHLRERGAHKSRPVYSTDRNGALLGGSYQGNLPRSQGRVPDPLRCHYLRPFRSSCQKGTFGPSWFVFRSWGQ